MTEPAAPGPGDRDALAVRHPATSPAQLAEIAGRRWDLHPFIAVHPNAYPALRQWTARVDPNPSASSQSSQWPPPGSAYLPPGSAYPPPGPAYPPVWSKPQRNGNAGWLVGCGCLALAVVVGVLGLGVVGLRLSGGDTGHEQSSAAGRDGDGSDRELLADFAAEQRKYHRLAAELDGNPVAPIVTRALEFSRLEERAKRPHLGEYSARSLAQGAKRIRKQLQRDVSIAEGRRDNRSGSLTEEIVDRAGKGFINIRWDAASVCPNSEHEGWRTTGCVTKGDTLTVHLLAEHQLENDWHKRLVVAHELAHIYQRADRARFLSNRGRWDRLVKQGLFQGSQEKMADCYALTYYDEWSLARGNVSIGYGYVCGAKERRAIRSWASGMNAPMPR